MPTDTQPTHTPGPWALEGTDVVAYLLHPTRSDPTGESNPRVRSVVARKVLDDTDGRLIAAAPELLEALRALVTVCPTDSLARVQVRAWALDAIARVTPA